MNKKFFKYVTSISVAAVIVLATAVWVCIGNAEKKMTQYSFDELTSSTRHLAGECADTINTDKTILSAMASLISMQDPSDTARIVEIMNSVDFSNTFITRVELITSDNKLLSQTVNCQICPVLLIFRRRQQRAAMYPANVRTHSIPMHPCCTIPFRLYATVTPRRFCAAFCCLRKYQKRIPSSFTAARRLC